MTRGAWVAWALSVVALLTFGMSRGGATASVMIVGALTAGLAFGWYFRDRRTGYSSPWQRGRRGDRLRRR